MHVERSTSIQAPPEKIFPLINDIHSWSSWSPYEKRDPAMKKNYSGAPDVKWTMGGSSPHIAKLIGVFVNMDTMIGADFETGLASLKTIAEE